MNKNITLLALLFSLLFLNCNHPCKTRRMHRKEAKNTVSTVPVVTTDTTAITPTPIGDWVLIRYICCGRTTSTKNFNAADNMISLHLGEDMKFSSFDKLNSSGKNSGTYTYNEKGELGKTLQLGNDNPAMLYMKSNDTLVLSWGYMDLQTEVYLRKQ